MRWARLLCAACVIAVPRSAGAQADFGATTIVKGQVVRVTEPSGVWLQGEVTDVMPATLTVGGHVFQPRPGLKVERLGDAIWNGAVIGFGIGALFGGAIDRTSCHSRKTPGCVIKPGLVFGVAGALIDRAIVGRRTVFVGRSPGSALRLQLPERGRGLVATLSF
jgi:hypothetical protein